MDQFEGKVAVITGAANPRGIGFAAGRRFAGLGCKVVLADIDAAGLDARIAELRAGGAEAVGVVTDMADYHAVQQLAHRTYEAFGAAHVVLLNQFAMGFPRHSFWAHPTVEDDERLAGGRQREVIEWENELYRRRCAALVERSAPDPCLWGRSNVMG